MQEMIEAVIKGLRNSKPDPGQPSYNQYMAAWTDDVESIAAELHTWLDKSIFLRAVKED